MVERCWAWAESAFTNRKELGWFVEAKIDARGTDTLKSGGKMNVKAMISVILSTNGVAYNITPLEVKVVGSLNLGLPFVIYNNTIRNGKECSQGQGYIKLRLAR